MDLHVFFVFFFFFVCLLFLWWFAKPNVKNTIIAAKICWPNFQRKTKHVLNFGKELILQFIEVF